MLNLDFTDEQDMLRDMVRGVCAQYASNEEVRRLEDDPTGYSAELWGQLTELGLVGLLLPEEYGGAGSSMVDGVGCGWVSLDITLTASSPERGERTSSTCAARVALPTTADDNPWARHGEDWQP